MNGLLLFYSVVVLIEFFFLSGVSEEQWWGLLSFICLFSVPVRWLHPPALIGLIAAGWLVRSPLTCVMMSDIIWIWLFWWPNKWKKSSERWDWSVSDTNAEGRTAGVTFFCGFSINRTWLQSVWYLRKYRTPPFRLHYFHHHKQHIAKSLGTNRTLKVHISNPIQHDHNIQKNTEMKILVK